MPLQWKQNLPFYTEKRVSITCGNLPPITTITISVKKSEDVNAPKPFTSSGKLELAILPQEWKNIQNVEQPIMSIAGPSGSHTLEQCVFLYDEKSSMFLIESRTFI